MRRNNRKGKDHLKWADLIQKRFQKRQDSCLQGLMCAAGIRCTLITFKAVVFKLCSAELQGFCDDPWVAGGKRRREG